MEKTYRTYRNGSDSDTEIDDSPFEVFRNPKFGVIRTKIIDGDLWFIGKDVASALGYERPAKAIPDRVDEEGRKMIDKETQSQIGIEIGQRGGWLINESGLYSLILSSKLPTAKKFKRWVTSEVLPVCWKGVSILDTPFPILS